MWGLHVLTPRMSRHFFFLIKHNYIYSTLKLETLKTKWRTLEHTFSYTKTWAFSSSNYLNMKAEMCPLYTFISCHGKSNSFLWMVLYGDTFEARGNSEMACVVILVSLYFFDLKVDETQGWINCHLKTIERDWMQLLNNALCLVHWLRQRNPHIANNLILSCVLSQHRSTATEPIWSVIYI